MLELPAAVLWDGIYGAALSAAIGALVAVGAIHLSSRAGIRSWYHQRQIESYREVLDAVGHSWDVAAKDSDEYESVADESREVGASSAAPSSPESPHSDNRLSSSDREAIRQIAAIRTMQERAIFASTARASRAIDLWSLYLLPRSGKHIEGALRRAVAVLRGEWYYSSFEARGTFSLIISGDFHREWDSLVILANRWHRASTRFSRWRISRRLKQQFLMTPRGIDDIFRDFSDDAIQGRIRLD